MPRSSPSPAAALALAACVCAGLGGCSRESVETEATLPPPASVATAAIQHLDTDGTGSLTGVEISASPALVAAQAQFDVDGNGSITRQEFEERLASYHNSSVVLMVVPCQVRYAGRPLAGAEVVFEPEPFMGNTAAPARGTTAPDGSVQLQTSGERFPGLYMGLYRIRISKKDESGREIIPERYNVRTELGQEIALENRKLAGGVVLQLEAR
jgi:hypothetical protein